ncbi:hypothetical protein Nepgr_013155 [Nepenthes gracilis]|uniref:Uncharacterized protein n=1 Tax=Nepenthes gracilis TaxID=150966 RepID=A0AAD3SIL5_NEPGR|nr:hypothetical protein Nepgr_013155 [Nepenthes gracilis]
MIHYIEGYSTLMLKIPNMTEKNHLLFFMDGLQRCTELELKRRNVEGLASAIVEVESLIEFQHDTNKDKQRMIVPTNLGETNHITR